MSIFRSAPQVGMIYYIKYARLVKNAHVIMPIIIKNTNEIEYDRRLINFQNHYQNKYYYILL